ncbi:SURF1 family protein [Microbacterium sp.]|uniref:SURF1 family cytochrome oxidase biogenesis protein n=1 Tax=Microbacterium sp. TaxID=51671 RepID=UPI003A8AB9E6
MNGRRWARWAGYVAFAVAFAIACGFLANWQFARSAERNAQLDLVASNYDATPVALEEVIPLGSEFAAADTWRPVRLTGEYLTDQQTLVRNRPHGGTSAFEVLVPLRTEDGRIVVVDRGWVPPGREQPEPDAVPAPPTGIVSVEVRLRPSEPLPRSGRSAPPGQVPTLNVPTVAAAIGEENVVAGAYGLMVSEDPSPAERPNALEEPSDDPGPHLSYAIQWILFAIMGFAFIWYTIRSERRHRREEAEGRPSRPARPRHDRDMAEEDALIDAAQR